MLGARARLQCVAHGCEPGFDEGFYFVMPADCGLDLSRAKNAGQLLERSRAAGFGDLYFPELARVIADKR